MSYVLAPEKQLTVIRLLVEGNSISSISRLTGIHRATICKWIVRIGKACFLFLERELNDLEPNEIEVDELWTYVRKKIKNWTGLEPDAEEIGEFYMFVAFDRDTKLVMSHRIGRRDRDTALDFFRDLRQRLKKKIPTPHESDDHAFRKGKNDPIIRLYTDGFEPYPDVIDRVFHGYAEYGQIIKNFKKDGPEAKRRVVHGNFDRDDISTSLIERNNLTIRTFGRRFMRRTLGFSKKLENLRAATMLQFAHFNYCWRVKTLKTTPAVAAGLARRPMEVADLYQILRENWSELFFEM